MERGVRKPLLERLTTYVVWRLTVGILYISGLTLLIPYLFLFVFPQDLNVISSGASSALLWTAIGLVVVSLLATVWLTASLGGALKMLGRVTFLPGLLGLVFTMFGRDMVMLYLAGTLPAFEKVQGLLSFYVDTAVPHVRYLTLGYFVLGVVLWLLGDKIESEAAISRMRTLKVHP